MMMGMLPASVIAAGAPPVPTHLGASASVTAGVTQSTSSPFSSSAAAGRMVIFAAMVNSPGAIASSATVTPNVGNAVSATFVENFDDGQTLGVMGYAVLDGTADTATAIDLSITFAASPFAAAQFAMWTVPSANVSSQTPTGHNHNSNAAGTSVSTTVATTSSGFIIAAGASNSISGSSGALSGTETFTSHTFLAAGHQSVFGEASGIATNASSTVTAGSFTGSGDINLVAAAWR